MIVLFDVDGTLVRIYPVGQIPNQLIEEDPLFSGNPLKRGRSIVNRLNWSNIDEGIRQFCRIVVERNDIDLSDRLAVRELLKLAMRGFASLKDVYPEADLEYRERKESNELPNLQLTIQDSGQGVCRQGQPALLGIQAG